MAESNLTMPEALPSVFIAVHDVFSTGTVQTISADIPTIVLLGGQEEIPENLRYADQWIESGVLLNDIEHLASVVTRWVNSDFKIPEYLSQSFKKDWCGSGNPPIELQLQHLLTNGQSLRG